MMEILDTTLREDEQTPCVNFMIDQMLHIARLLDQIGVDMIEAGDPSVSTNVAKAIERIASLGLQADIAAHSPASRSGIDKAKAFGALVLQESGHSFTDIQASRSLVHKKISFCGDSRNQKPPGYPFFRSLAVLDWRSVAGAGLEPATSGL